MIILSDTKMRKLFITLLVGFIGFSLLKLGAKAYNYWQVCTKVFGFESVLGHLSECKSKIFEMSMQIVTQGTKAMPQAFVDTLSQVSMITAIIDLLCYAVVLGVLVRCVLIFRQSKSEVV